MTLPATAFIIPSEDGFLCPVCGLAGYFRGDHFDDIEGGCIATGICPCCSYEPGFDDNPMASKNAKSTIAESIAFYRRGWIEAGRPWRGGDQTVAPASWSADEQLARLFRIAPFLAEVSESAKPNFVLKRSHYEAVVPFLRLAAAPFFSSAEYAIVEGNDELPGIVLAAFGNYLGRLARQSEHLAELQDGVAAVNVLYEWNDAAVREAIRDEFIESFAGNPVAIERIRPFLCTGLAEEFTRTLAKFN